MSDNCVASLSSVLIAKTRQPRASETAAPCSRTESPLPTLAIPINWKKGLRFAAGLFLLWLPSASATETYYQQPADFLHEAFDGTVPEPSLLWLTGERGDAAAAILGHRPASLRVRYWRADERTAWILEEIGREELITAGFIVDEGRLSRVRTLAFRESRGWEIRYDFFTDQFKGVGLDENHSLDQPIDSITGATLSVNAMRRMARLALYLDSVVRDVAP